MTPYGYQLIEPLTWLSGEWKGEGNGEFPTIDSFVYTDRMQFKIIEHVIEKEPLIGFEEKAWVLEKGKEVFKHWETGFFKPRPEGDIQFYLVHNTGRIEIAYGNYEWIDVPQKAFKITFESDYIRNDRGLTSLQKSRRVFYLRDNYLTYSLSMCTVEINNWTTHLHCRLVRADV